MELKRNQVTHVESIGKSEGLSVMWDESKVSVFFTKKKTKVKYQFWNL